MQIIYNIVFILFAIVSIPKFLVRLNQSRSSQELLRERFGFLPRDLPQKLSDQKVVWVHAVSVGEVMAVRGWIRSFLQMYPDWTVALSVTTPTGRSVAQSLASEKVVIFYAPFDLSAVVRRFIQSLKPRLILLMETEIWPNLILEAGKSKIPIGIMNGRLSPRSFQRYRLIRGWISSLLNRLSFCLVQTERDRAYFSGLGMAGEKMALTGNMKFDQDQISEGIFHQDRSKPRDFSADGLIFVCGSTSWNEEEMLLRVYQRLLGIFKNLQLVLAPRHPEQISKIARAIQRRQLRFRFFSEKHLETPFQVLLVNQMGVLKHLYSFADVVFIGGSFTRRGGQNPIEPAQFKKPLLHGPHVFNFHEVYRSLDQQEAAFRVTSEEELFEKVKTLLGAPELRRQMGETAWAAIQSMKGATARTLDLLANWIQTQEPSAAVR